MSNQVDRHYYEVATPGSTSEKLAAIARDKIYTDFLRLCGPSASDRILDVGVSDVVGDAANVLERRYSPQCNITAVGLGRGDAFKASFPQVQYRQVVANDALPFDDGSFDIVTSNAVLEHVGSLENQRFFISELLRVGGRVFVTVPHRFFPIEHHTAIPFLHWFDSPFTLACRLFGKEKWGIASEFDFMSQQKLRGVYLARMAAEIGRTGIMLGPWSSNLYLFALSPKSRDH